jgi:hypothetical protein
MSTFGTVVDMTRWPEVNGRKLTFKDPVHTNEGMEVFRALLETVQKASKR